MQRAMSTWTIVFGLVGTLGLVAAGCASPDTQTAEPREDKTYVTGSRIPVRDGSTSASVKSVTLLNPSTIAAGSIFPPKGGPQ